jgi:GNAT superfamily N-acetyltransferase
MKLGLAETKEQFLRCYPVMVELRPHLNAAQFLAAVQRQQREGYQLLYLEDADEVRALAGFRLQEMLAQGRFLYVDDLITAATQRSRGYGEALIEWLKEYARAAQCVTLQLDSRVHRFDAHRFYFTQRMWISAYHFELKLEQGVA